MNSNQWFEKAKMYIPGGVNSPVRAFRDVGGTPIYFKTALGSLIQTEDNIELIDFCNSFGPTILGAHSPDERASVKSTQKFWIFFKEILKNIPKSN